MEDARYAEIRDAVLARLARRFGELASEHDAFFSQAMEELLAAERRGENIGNPVGFAVRRAERRAIDYVRQLKRRPTERLDSLSEADAGVALPPEDEPEERAHERAERRDRRAKKKLPAAYRTIVKAVERLRKKGHSQGIRDKVARALNVTRDKVDAALKMYERARSGMKRRDIQPTPKSREVPLRLAQKDLDALAQSEVTFGVFVGRLGGHASTTESGTLPHESIRMNAAVTEEQYSRLQQDARAKGRPIAHLVRSAVRRRLIPALGHRAKKT